MRVTGYLMEDHERLHRLLARAAGEPFDHEAFEQFRGGLLRHIGIEEKLLFSEVRRRLGEPLDVARRRSAAPSDRSSDAKRALPGESGHPSSWRA